MKRVLDKKVIEEIATKKGYVDLSWLSPPDVLGENSLENTKYVLFGCPKDYSGPYGDYNEPLFAQMVSGNRIKTIGYKEIVGGSMGEILVGDWTKMA
jgi:hypothetical protein